MTAAPSLESLIQRRGKLAAELKDIDRQINSLTHPKPGPLVLVRPDGSVLADGNCRPAYRQDMPPRRFMYRGAAERRAEADGATVMPFSVWLQTRQPARAEVSS